MIHYRIPGVFPAEMLCGAAIEPGATQFTILKVRTSCPACRAEFDREAAEDAAMIRAALNRRVAARVEFSATIFWSGGTTISVGGTQGTTSNSSATPKASNSSKSSRTDEKFDFGGPS